MVCAVSFLPSVWMDVRCMTTGTFGSSWGRSLGTWSVGLEQPSERREGERRERGERGERGREGGETNLIYDLLLCCRVLAVVSCEVVQPRPQRPTEGQLFFNIELSPMASPAFEIGRLVNWGRRGGRGRERGREGREMEGEGNQIRALHSLSSKFCESYVVSWVASA